jgi:hypothetical protein
MRAGWIYWQMKRPRTSAPGTRIGRPGTPGATGRGTSAQFWPVPWPKRCTRADEQTDEYQALAIADYLDPPAKAGRWVNQLRFQTLEALRLPGVWSAVDTVAKALVNRQTLNGPRVHALVCQTLPCAPAAGVPMNATPWPLFKAAAKRPARRKLGQ